MWQAAHPGMCWGFAGLPVVWWSMRGLRQALPRWRFAGVALTRHLLLATMLLGLAGAGSVHLVPREPVIMYLVDRSASIDPTERAWQTRTLARLDTALSERTERILMTFGGHARTVERRSAHQAVDTAVLTADKRDDALQPGSTNVQGALLSGFSATTEDRAKRIVLLSDGLQTAGDALQVANVARLEHIPIFTYLPPASGQNDVALTKILVPQVARKQMPTAVRVGLENFSQHAVRARLLVRGPDGQSLFDQRFLLPSGKHLVEVPVRPEATGGFQVTATVEAEGDLVRANNTRTAAFEVIGPPRVLLIGNARNQAPYVAQVLQARQMEVDVQELSGMPATLPQLVAYDAVIFSDVPRTALDPSQMELLKRYVQEFGGGLVVIGSGGDLATEAGAKTVLDDLLPARWTLDAPQQHEAQTRLSLFLLVDRSSSMSGSRMTLMKYGAVELVKQLSPTDMLGVMAFDTRPFIVLPLQPVGLSRSTIVDRLVRIRAGGGTNFLPALVEAKARVNDSGAVVKHLILLSDGGTIEPNSPFYLQFTHECQEEHVTVSTILLGLLFVDEEIMQRLAHETDGMFYHLRDERELPRLIVTDTQQVLSRSPFAEGWFRPTLAQPHEAVRGLSDRDLPPLKGYLVMQAKPAAITSLVISSEERERDPLLVHWAAGLGRVTMFASDAESRWSSPWISWDQYQKFWSQVIAWTMRRSSLRELTTRIEYVGGSPLLAVHTPPSTQRLDQFVVRLMPIGETSVTELPLSRVSPTQWRASLEGVKPGLYQAVFLQTAQGQLVGETRRWIDVSTHALGLAEETPAAPPDAALLTALAERSGGAVDASPDAIVGQHPTQRVVDRWDRWLIPLFLALFLVDVALRGETML